jgi:carboxylate-amine ligase
MDIKFNDSKDFTLGVELELQLVDGDTLSLVQKSSDILGSLTEHRDSVKHELMMSNLEIITAICKDVGEADEDLRKKLKTVIDTAGRHNTLISSASTHPFSSWKDQILTDDPRYKRLRHTLQIISRRFNIFGLHVHVGVNGGERCIYIMNRLIYYLPHLLAISTNSPFWEGEDTGLKSYRSKIFESLPHGGLPFYFKDWADYKKLVNNYLATGTIETMRELWWDVRPHPDFGTVELRICDIPSTLKEVLAIAALIQAIVKKLSDDFDKGVVFTRPHSAVTRENKWRACRYGLDGEFMTKDGGGTIGIKDAMLGILDTVADEADALGSLEYLKGIEEIVREGTGASRQLELWQERGDFKDVVRALTGVLAAEVSAGSGGGRGAGGEGGGGGER